MRNHLLSSPDRPERSSVPHRTGVMLQRCACGSATGSLAGECEECKKKKQLQAKLTVGAVNDPLEHEADRVADQVLSTPRNCAVTPAPVRVQRASAHAGAMAGTVPASVDRVLASTGRPLDQPLRQDMEQRFGHDFSSVRVHSGDAAARSADDVSANAYTVGHDVVFGAGRYAPGTHDGRRLIAHELTHVLQQGSPGAGASLQRQPQHGENRALKDGVPMEKWSEELERQYRLRGHTARANAMRACRLEGISACKKILTSADLQALYDRDIVPVVPQGKQHAQGPTVSTPTIAGAGVVAATAYALKGAAGVESTVATSGAARAMAAWGVESVSVPLGAQGAATTATIATGAEVGTGAAVATGTEVAGGTAVAGGGLGVLAAGSAVALPLAISAIHWHKWKAFQDKWIAAGYILLEDPLRVCIGGCHLPSQPKQPRFPDLADLDPVEPITPFPFRVPQQPLPPGYTPLTPFEPARGGPKQKPTPTPTPTPRATPKPDPRADDRRRRRKPCEPHLELPFGKKVHEELYGFQILSSRLASAPTSIVNRQRTSAYERNSAQVTKWFAAVDPDKGGAMDPKVVDRGTKLLSADQNCRNKACEDAQRSRVLKPDWTPSGKQMQMDVDHITELQVGYLIGEDNLDQFSNYELLDSSTNSSTGPTLDASIQRERARLKRDCPSTMFNWDEMPLVFTLPMFEGGGKGPGERWTRTDILKGKHLDAYPRRRRGGTRG